METRYPINLIGIEDGKTSGDVITRHGEYLGIWTFNKDEENETGVLAFTADGETDAKFTETVNFLESGLVTGFAMSNICRSIDTWHNQTQ